MVGEIGALGGGILPNVLGQSKQHTGSFGVGFACYAGFATMVLVMLADRVAQVDENMGWCWRSRPWFSPNPTHRLRRRTNRNS